jgi:hypothetical protein
MIYGWADGSRLTRHQTLEAINIDRPTRHQKKRDISKTPQEIGQLDTKCPLTTCLYDPP